MRLLTAICRFLHSPLSVDDIARARNTTEVPLSSSFCAEAATHREKDSNWY